jgi:AraC-like DNA-binding protein
MESREPRSGGRGLERSCGRRPAESWIASRAPAHGIELFRAWFAGEAYQKHRHDTYAVGLTDRGVQVFDYRGSVRTALPGEVVALYPDEPHDGRAGTADGFGYRIVYVEPSRLAGALRAVRGRPCPLPFLRDPVSRDARLARAVADAFGAPAESLAIDSVVVGLAEGLAGGDAGPAGAGEGPAPSHHVDARALIRAREFLDAQRTRAVHSTELESITGLTRYELARQFRIAFGTSPYRYLLMRRLDLARELIHRAGPLVEVAYEAGFADQAHFTRTFKAAFGLTPARYRALRAAGTRSLQAR